MAIIDFGGEGEKTLVAGGAVFVLDTVWSKYEEAWEREHKLSAAGYAVRKTEINDTGGRLSKRGRDTILYLIWKRKGKSALPEPKGRKPKR